MDLTMDEFQRLSDEKSQQALTVAELQRQLAVKTLENAKLMEEARAQVDSKIASGICPKCGGTLIMRNGKYGSFYGCSNYPRCRFTAQ